MKLRFLAIFFQKYVIYDVSTSPHTLLQYLKVFQKEEQLALEVLEKIYMKTERFVSKSLMLRVLLYTSQELEQITLLRLVLELNLQVATKLLALILSDFVV